MMVVYFYLHKCSTVEDQAEKIKRWNLKNWTQKVKIQNFKAQGAFVIYALEITPNFNYLHS